MYLARKYLLRILFFSSPSGDGTSILRSHPSHTKFKPFERQRKYFHFSVILLQTLSIGPVPGIEPTTYISAVGRSTDGKIPAAVEVKFLRDDYFR